MNAGELVVVAKVVGIAIEDTGELTLTLTPPTDTFSVGPPI